MSKTLKYLKELPLEKQNTFWETIFGFTTYTQALERFSIEESTLNKPLKNTPLNRIVIFLKYLEDYRTLIDTEKIHTFQQVKEKQLRVFTKNDFQQLWPPLNLFLDAKLFPENKSSKQNILETKSNKEKEFQNMQLHYINKLMEIDSVFLSMFKCALVHSVDLSFIFLENILTQLPIRQLMILATLIGFIPWKRSKMVILIK